jgi:hypothetical protein
MRSSTSRKAATVATLTVVGMTLDAAPALACPNCFAAKENVLWAYYSTTVFLSLLPLALFGGIALYWYKKRGQAPFSQE